MRVNHDFPSTSVERFDHFGIFGKFCNFFTCFFPEKRKMKSNNVFEIQKKTVTSSTRIQTCTCCESETKLKPFQRIGHINENFSTKISSMLKGVLDTGPGNGQDNDLETKWSG
jgi:hypothetical protein